MKGNKRVLLVDDDKGLADLISIRLNAEGYHVDVAYDGYSGLSMVSSFNPHVVVTDLKMNGMDGIQLMDAIQKQHPGLPIIILTAYGTIPDAVRATNKGVFSFLTKPFDAKRLLEEVGRACKLANVQEAEPEESDTSWREGVITCSPIMEGLLRRARLVAATDSSVFITGPSGSGKEVLAQAIHKASRRSSGPMIAVNCAAISDGLFESELFGHVKGSFTGANKEHLGLFLAATGGTLFLDEIADIPLAFQAKMLRAIQEREIRPVGSVESKPIDIRLISASWQDLDEAITAARFRQDLYYRLNVVSLEVPSLAQRREDIPLLARHFINNLAKEGEKTVTGFSQEAIDLLFTADWPGNVRQLYNVVEQTYALTTSPIIPESLVRQAVNDTGDNAIIPLTEAKRAFEREYLTKALRLTSGNVSRAAMLSGRNRTDFYKLLSRHGIHPEHFKRLG